MAAEPRQFEYRAVVGDKDRPGTFDEEGEPFGTEQEARDDMARMLTLEFAHPVYDVGWVEKRLAPTPWERLP